MLHIRPLLVGQGMNLGLRDAVFLEKVPSKHRHLITKQVLVAFYANTPKVDENVRLGSSGLQGIPNSSRLTYIFVALVGASASG